VCRIREKVATMASDQNLYRTENYQNYINSHHQRPPVAKSISEQQKHKTNDGDADSINSVAESLNNYLDVKVRDLIDRPVHKVCCRHHKFAINFNYF
jgi:hypothetical protein